MIKMVSAKATTSGAVHELRKEFYELYMEDFSIIKEYEVMDEAEIAKAAAVKEVPVEMPKVEAAPKANTKGK